ncbi:MAG: hypothetical protein ABFD64_07045 [Armatimonadota bacterium]
MQTNFNPSSGSRFLGRGAAGQDTQPFMEAVRARAGYRKPTDKSTGIVIYADDGRRKVKVGILMPDRVLVKTVKHEHILRNPPSIALQTSVLYQLNGLNCHTIRAELPDNVVLTAPLERFFKRGKPIDRGYGRQTALLMADWDNADTTQRSLF